jgi:hypothetical protein
VSLGVRSARIVAAQGLGIASVEHREGQARVEPTSGLARELRVDRQAGDEGQAPLLHCGSEVIEVRPRPFGIDVIGGDRRDPAEVIDAGIQENPRIIDEVGWCLQVDVGRQDAPGQLDRIDENVDRARWMVAHHGAGLRNEVLDDHLLHVAISGMRGGNRLQGRDTVITGFADPDEDARGEGDRELAGRVQRREAPLRILVWSASVGGQVGVERLDHHSLARGHGPKPPQVVAAEGSGVDVGQQAGLLEHCPRRIHDVVDRRGVSPLREPRTRLAVAVLGELAQGEQCLVAAGLRTVTRDGQDLVHRQVGRCQMSG